MPLEVQSLIQPAKLIPIKKVTGFSALHIIHVVIPGHPGQICGPQGFRFSSHIFLIPHNDAQRLCLRLRIAINVQTGFVQHVARTLPGIRSTIMNLLKRHPFYLHPLHSSRRLSIVKSQSTTALISVKKNRTNVSIIKLGFTASLGISSRAHVTVGHLSEQTGWPSGNSRNSAIQHSSPGKKTQPTAPSGDNSVKRRGMRCFGSKSRLRNPKSRVLAGHND